jgi:hypothetical protein
VSCRNTSAPIPFQRKCLKNSWQRPPSEKSRNEVRHCGGKCLVNPIICRSGPPKNVDAVKWTIRMGQPLDSIPRLFQGQEV